MSAAANQDILLCGFDDPVDASGRAFRSLLNAMAHPGTVFPVQGPREFPSVLSDAASAVLLTLCDYATPVWLSDSLTVPDVQSYLRFHTAAPIIAAPARAAFAVLDKGFEPLMAGRFSPGTQDYPDRATTVIVEVESFGDGESATLSGPGIEATTTLGVSGLPLSFWEDMQTNNAGFPLGIDVILTARGELCAIPRSITIEVL